VAIAVLYIHFAISCLEAAEPRRVLLMHSFGREFAPFNEFSVRFREELVRQSPEPLDIYEASYETARFSDTIDEKPFVEYLHALFAERKLDLIVSIGGPAANFVKRQQARLFPSTPRLIAAADARVVGNARTSNTAAVVVTIDVGKIIDNILEVLPDTKNIAVVIGSSPLEKFWLTEMQKQLQPFSDRVNPLWLHDLPLEGLLARAAALPAQSAVLYAIFAADSDGVPHEQDRVVTALHARANAPVFSYIDNFLGRGIVGGPLISNAEISRRTAEVAVRILGGTSPADINVPPVGLATPAYDWRELQRWKISEANLPKDSIVQFRQPTVWQRYRWPIIAVAAAMLLQIAIIAWLLVEHRRRRRAELEAQRRLLEVIHLNGTAAAGALSASIAHELNQPLGAILSNAEAGEILLAAKPPDLGQMKDILADIRQADQRAAEIIQRLPKLLKRRSEIELQEFDLNEAIGEAVQILSPEATRRGIDLTANYVERPLRVRADQIHLQQVILNLAANGMDAMRDSASGARAMVVETVNAGSSAAEVAVIDNGSGIPPGKLSEVFETFYTTKREGTGLGLSIARAIVENYGGRIWAENRSGGGAVIRFTLPLIKPQSA